MEEIKMHESTHSSFLRIKNLLNEDFLHECGCMGSEVIPDHDEFEDGHIDLDEPVIDIGDDHFGHDEEPISLPPVPVKKITIIAIKKPEMY